MVDKASLSRNAVTSQLKLPRLNVESTFQVLDLHEIFWLFEQMMDEFDAPFTFDPADVQACIRAIRSKNIYSRVKHSIGVTTHHSLERMLNGKSLHSGDIREFHNSNQWRSYDRGLHVPSAKKVADVEKRTGIKLRHERNQVLWVAIDLATPLGNQLPKLARRLPSKISQLTRQCSLDMNRVHHGVVARERAIYTSCLELMDEAGLPALAALTLLLRKAHEHRQQDVAFTIALFIFRMLLILGAELQQRGIARLIYEFYLKNIFPLCRNQKLYETALGIAVASLLLNTLAFVIREKSSNCTPSFSERVQGMKGLLIGKYGSGPAAALIPLFGPASTTAGREAWGRFMQRLNSRNHAWDALCRCLQNCALPLVFAPGWIDPALDFGIFRKDQEQPSR